MNCIYLIRPYPLPYKSLEKELGLALLEKTARGATLTHKGKQLVEISADFIHALEGIFLDNQPAPEIFTVRIAASYLSITNYLADRLSCCADLPLTLKPIFLEYPDSADIINAVHTQMADIGFCAIFRPSALTPPLAFDPQLSSTLSFRSVAKLPIHCEMSVSHPLAYLSHIPLNKLRKYTLRYFYPRLPSQNASGLSNDAVFQFTHFFRQFDFAIESNPTFYTQALVNDDCIGITIAETPHTPYGLLRIPLQADCFFELIAVRPIKDCYNQAENFLFYG